MSLKFPPCVPEASRPPVVAAQATAEGELRKALQQKPIHHFRGGHSSVDRSYCREHCASYVSTVVFVLAHEVCQAARARALSVDEITSCIEEFIHKLTVAAYYDFKLTDAWSRWESFRDEMEPAILESGGWREHLRERAAVAADLVVTESTNSPDSPVLQSSSSDEPSMMDKPLLERERLSLLRIIKALAKEAKIDISRPTAAGVTISAMTETGPDGRVAPTAVARQLRRIRDDI